MNVNKSVSIPNYISYRGRFAPSPTGVLHFGSLVIALGSWLRAKAINGIWLVRIEDIDPARERLGAAKAILATLAAFGLHSDEPVLFQSQRREHYWQVLSSLRAKGKAFPCNCTRSKIVDSGVHRGPCVASRNSPVCWRLQVNDALWQFEDGIAGKINQHSSEVGDFIIWRADNLPAYQLAVVVDDEAQGITEVVRGADLLNSTPRQIYMQQLLGYSTPNYLHFPLAVDNNGIKLSKSIASLAVDGADPLPALRRALVFLGQPDHGSISSTELLLSRAIATFDIAKIPQIRQQVVT